MKAVSIVGVLVFLLITVGSASADVVLTRANEAYPGSLQINVTYDNLGNGTITFLDQSAGVSNPGIAGVGYNLDIDAQQITGYKMNSNTEQVLYNADSKNQNENKWMQKNNFGAEGEFGTFLRLYGEDQGDSDRFYKVVVKFSSFDGKVPANEKGNQVGANFVCDEFSCFLAGPGNGGTTNENPALSLEKTALSAKYDTVGQKITYNYVVKNTGNVPITEPMVTDDKLGIVSRSGATLEPGSIITVIVIYTITQADLDAGSVTNVANATGTYKGNEIKSNTGAVTVTADKSALNFGRPASQTTYSATYNNMQVVSNDATGTATTDKPALMIVKSASPTNYSNVGQMIAYNYVVKNTGNVPIDELTVTDDKLGTVSRSSTPLAPDQIVTVAATYMITPADLDVGSVTSLANATGTFNGMEVKSNTGNVTIKADTEIPEFPSIVLPVAAVMGIMLILGRRRQND